MAAGLQWGDTGRARQVTQDMNPDRPNLGIKPAQYSAGRLNPEEEARQEAVQRRPTEPSLPRRKIKKITRTNSKTGKQTIRYEDAETGERVTKEETLVTRDKGSGVMRSQPVWMEDKLMPGRKVLVVPKGAMTPADFSAMTSPPEVSSMADASPVDSPLAAAISSGEDDNHQPTEELTPPWEISPAVREALEMADNPETRLFCTTSICRLLAIPFAHFPESVQARTMQGIETMMSDPLMTGYLSSLEKISGGVWPARKLAEVVLVTTALSALLPAVHEEVQTS